MKSLAGSRVFCAIHFVRPVRRATILALLTCGTLPCCMAAKLHQQYAAGVYLVRDGQMLQALRRRSPRIYWIDGYQMSISRQTQICWHDGPLQLGPVLNRNGQPVPRLTMTSPCETEPWDSVRQGAWLQYMAIQKFDRDTVKPSMKVAAARIDIWKSDSKENLSSGQSTVPQPAWQALCASTSQHQLQYPNEDPIDVVCDAKVNSYVGSVFSALLKPSALTSELLVREQEIPGFYVVRPFQVKQNYDFEAIDGSSGYYDLSFLSWYMNPRAHSAVQEIVYGPDGTVLIPDTALVHLGNEAQFAALLSYSLAAENQELIGRLFRVQRFKVSRWSRQKNGGNNLLYTVKYISNLNEQVLRLGIRGMYLAGYDIRYAPLAWAVERGKRIKGPVDEPNRHVPWYATYAFNAINQLYPNVDYGRLKRGRAEYAAFLKELRQADPEAFEQSKK